MEGQKLSTLMLMAILVSSIIFISGCVQEEGPTTTPAPEKGTTTKAPTITQPSETPEKVSPTATPTAGKITPTLTTVPSSQITALDEKWQVTPLSANTLPDSEKGYDKITFILLLENTGTKPQLLDVRSIGIEAKYQEYAYEGGAGKYLYISNLVPPGYRTLVTATLDVPSAVVDKAKYRFSLNAMVVEIPPPSFDIPIPKWQPPDANSFGKTFTVKDNWSITPKNVSYYVFEKVETGDIRIRIKPEIQFIIENLYGYAQEIDDSLKFLISSEDGVVLSIGNYDSGKVPPFAQTMLPLTIAPRIITVKPSLSLKYIEPEANQHLIVTVVDRDNEEIVQDYSAWTLNIPKEKQQPQLWSILQPDHSSTPIYALSPDIFLLYNVENFTAYKPKTGEVKWLNEVHSYVPGHEGYLNRKYKWKKGGLIRDIYPSLMEIEGSIVYIQDYSDIITLDLETWEVTKRVDLCSSFYSNCKIGHVAIEDGVVYSDVDGILFAFEIDSGEVLWRKTPEHPGGRYSMYYTLKNTPVSENILYIVEKYPSFKENEGGKDFQMLDLSTGELKSSFPLPDDLLKTIVQDTWLYITTRQNEFLAIDLSTGQHHPFTYETETWPDIEVINQGPINYIAVSVGQSLKLYKNDGKIQELWESENIGLPKAWDEDTLYFTGEKLRAVDLYTGREKWSADISSRFAAVQNQVLFIGTGWVTNKRLHALDLNIIEDELLSTSSASTTEPEDKDFESLAKVIASEAGSVWDVDQWVRCTDEERSAVGWTVLNRLNKGIFGNSIEEVVTAPGQYAYNQDPPPEINELAKKLLEGQIEDPTGGAAYFFSPISMPKEGQEDKCKPPVGNGIMDCDGGLNEVSGISEKVYFPSWTQTESWAGDLNNVRGAYFMFYRAD